MPRRVGRWVRVLGWVVAGLLVVELALVQAPMWLTRWRDARLLADFHTIVPTQSTWADAQKLMTRWGEFGKYEGSCTAESCSYSIEVGDPLYRRIVRLDEKWVERLQRFHVISAAERIGWRASSLSVRVVVRDGKIARTRTEMMLEVPNFAAQGDWGYPLLVNTATRYRLSLPDRDEYRKAPWILGTEEQLDDHPDYKAGRPGGCETCERVDVTYTPALARSEMERLTTYDLSCLTRLHPCTSPGELLPAAQAWHLYDENWHGPDVSGGPAPIGCRTVPRAIGRDAHVLLEVEGVSSETRQRDDLMGGSPENYEMDRVRVIRTLKGSLPAESGAIVQIDPFEGDESRNPRELAEHLQAGRRYFVVLERGEIYEDKSYAEERCGIVEDTPANLQQLLIGIAQDVEANEPTGWEE